MTIFIEKYKAFLWGLGITIFFTLFFQYLGVILIDPTAIGENLLLFTLWWGILSLPLYKLDYLKKNRLLIYKLLGLCCLLLMAVMVDELMDTPDNPITIFLLLTFWLTVVYILSPAFVKKYLWLIGAVYLVAFAYFTYIRLSAGSRGMFYGAEKEGAIFSLVMPIPVFIGLWLYEQWRWLKILQAEKSKAELALLKSQVNPHFFFNTLNNLYGLTVEKSEKAPAVILGLSDMMRYTIYDGQKNKVSIEDEIAYLENYIELHKIRYHKQVQINFEHHVESPCEVAPLLFIILLENAFKHGVETLVQDAFVNISLVVDAYKIVFCIENSIEQNQELSTEGIGLVNLRKRLELMYPNAYKLTTVYQESSYRATLEIDI